MARYLMTPFYRADGSDGAFWNGAKLYFYATGTTTPANTYQQASGGSAHANRLLRTRQTSSPRSTLMARPSIARSSKPRAARRSKTLTR